MLIERSTGNVGIGTDSPTSVLHISSITPEIYLEDSNNTADAKLLANNGNLGLFSDVNNEYASSIMYFNVDGSERMRIDSSGQVGIGTTTPSTKLDVTGDVTATTFLGELTGTINTATTAVTQANATNNTTVATTAYVDSMVGTIPAGLVFQGAWNANTNTPTLTSGSGTTGHFYIVSVAGSTNLDGITDWQVGDWAVFVEQGATDQWEKIDNSSVLDGAGLAGQIAYWSSTSQLAGDTNLFFDSTNDRVGIGTNSPAYKLSVKTTGTSAQTIAGFGNNNIDGLQIITSDGNLEWGFNVLNSRSLVFQTNQTERMRIDSSGQVKFNNYTSSSSFTGTAVANLAVDSSGNIITEAAGGGGGTVTGSGTATQVAFWSTSSELDGSNNLYWDSSNNRLGIGVSSPQETLDVSGFIQSDSIVIDQNSLFINSNQSPNVGLGTTSPSERLDVSGVIKSAGLKVNNNVIYVANSGTNVGIGTTSPSAKIDISFAGGSDSIKSTSTSSTSYNASKFYNDNSKGWHDLVYGSAYSGGSLMNVGADGAITYSNTTSGITTLGAFDLLLGTNSTERMRIDSSGNVGIGVSSPQEALDVSGFIQSDSIVIDQSSLFINSNQSPNVGMGTNSPSERLDVSGVVKSTGLKVNSNAIYVANFSTNVGIGTTSPTQKMHVGGNVRVEGAYYDSNNSSGTNSQLLSSTGFGTDWIDVPPAPSTDNQNGGSALQYWSGTQAQYDSISSPNANTIYFIT